MSVSLIRLPEVKRRTGKGKTSIYHDIAEGKFPPPVNLGPRAVAWVDQEIDDYVAARIAERDGKAA